MSSRRRSIDKWEDVFDPTAATAIRPYSLVKAAIMEDQVAAFWSLFFTGAGVGSLFYQYLRYGRMTLSGEIFAAGMVTRAMPTSMLVGLVLHSPDIAFAIGEDLEELQPGAGVQLSNAMLYSNTGHLGGGIMPVVPSSDTSDPLGGFSWESISDLFSSD